MEAYFDNVKKLAAMRPTILGHFDLIKKIIKGNKFFDEDAPRYHKAASDALAAAARNRCVLEVNTSGVARGFRRISSPPRLFCRSGWPSAAMWSSPPTPTPPTS